jgi:uncharacterized protein
MKRKHWIAAGLVALPLLGLGTRELMFRRPPRPLRPVRAKTVIDMHVHAAGLGAGGSGCYLSPEIRNSYKMKAYLKAYGLTREEVERGGDKLTVERIAQWVSESGALSTAVVLALDGAVKNGDLDLEHTEIYVPNEFVVGAIKPFPHLRFGASLNPLRKDALTRLETLKKEGAVLVKWVPPIQGIDPASEALTPFYKKLVELKLPLLSHTGHERAFTRSDDTLADPRRLELPLSLGVTVIAAHSGAPGKFDGKESMDWLLEMFPRHPNLYADISSLTQVNKLGYLRKILLDRRADKRLVHGSDFPLINTALVSPYFFPLDLTFRQMRHIAGIENPFDRDVALKQALGVPAEVFNHPFGARSP